jgi:antitoxin VapB
METQTAKIFLNGRSQAIRLPKDFRFEGKEVFITKVEFCLYNRNLTNPDSWTDFFMSGEKADPDFMKDRINLDLQERHIFDD